VNRDVFGVARPSQLGPDMSARARLAIVGLGLLVGACSTTEYRGSVVTPAAVAGLRAEHPDDTLRVEAPRSLAAPGFRSSSDLPDLARLVDVGPDHTTLTLSSEAAARVVPNESVKRLIVIRRGRGAAMGASVGVMVGVAAAIAAAATYSDPCAHGGDFCFEISRGDTSLLTGLVVGLPAIAIGAALGALVGDRTNYTFGPTGATPAN
jgi:hypothetical protein